MPAHQSLRLDSVASIHSTQLGSATFVELSLDMQPGALFVFEGPDGVGKTTLSLAVREALVSRRTSKVSVFSFPGSTPGTIGALVYRIHHDPHQYGVAQITATALQLLHIAAHLDAINREIHPRISAGEIILLDRYWWSSRVYGMLSGADPDALEAMIALEREYWGEVHPNAVFLISRPLEAIPDDDRPEFERREKEYCTLAASQPNVVRLYNATTIEAAVDRILGEIDSRYKTGSEFLTP